MHKAVSRALWGAFFVGGLTVLGAGAAHAADTSGEDGVASGNQVGVLGELPVTIGGNAISILGDSESSSGVAASSGSGDVTTGNATTNGEDSIVGGNQVMPNVTAPVTVGGNAISILGDSSATGTQPSTPGETTGDAPASTTGEDGIASGNQVMPNVTAPVTVGGNDISVGDDLVREDGALDDGMLDDGLLSGPAIELPLVDDVLLIGPVIDRRLSIEPRLAEALVLAPDSSAPVVEGPLVDVDVDVTSPVSAGAATESDVIGAGGPAFGLSPAMATAAVLPAAMLAATGVEALPLLGGIAIMLAIGLGLLGLKQTALG